MTQREPIASFRDLELLPHYRIATVQEGAPAVVSADTWPRTLRLTPGAGFGSGAHETTQLCLLALAHLLRTQQVPAKALDFGAGSGVLSVAAALCGVRVDAVEIDESAIVHGRENARLNGVSALIEWATELREPACRYGLIVANILLPVLLQYGPQLCARLEPAAPLVLSGLTATDVAVLSSRYAVWLPRHRAEVYERGEWRAVLYRPTS